MAQGLKQTKANIYYKLYFSTIWSTDIVGPKDLNIQIYIQINIGRIFQGLKGHVTGASLGPALKTGLSLGCTRLEHPGPAGLTPYRAVPFNVV